MPAFLFKGGIDDKIPDGWSPIQISELTVNTDLSRKYLKLKIIHRYQHHRCQVNRLKMWLADEQGQQIVLFSTGRISDDLDVCRDGDTLLCLNCRVDYSDPIQIIAETTQELSSLIWIFRPVDNQTCATSDGHSVTPTVLRRDVVQSKVSKPAASKVLKSDEQSGGSKPITPKISRPDSQTKVNQPTALKSKVCKTGDTQTCGPKDNQPVAANVKIFRPVDNQTCETSDGHSDTPTVLRRDVVQSKVSKPAASKVLKSDEQSGGSKPITPKISRPDSQTKVNQPTALKSKVCKTGDTQTCGPKDNQPVASNVKDKQPAVEKSLHSYSYKKLSDIRVNTIVDVYGVVTFSKPVARGRGKDYYCVVCLTDPSIKKSNMDKLSCTFFNREAENLPSVAEGDIVRLHRLKIQTYNGTKQGHNGSGFQWLVFRGSTEPIASSSDNYTFEDQDKVLVKELLEWWSEEVSEASQSEITIASIAPRRYFDIICQVVQVCMPLQPDESLCRLLRVWDGTKSNIRSIKSLGDHEMDRNLESDDLLVEISRDFTVDIFTFDDHAEASSNIKPGDFVLLTNVHSAVVSYTTELTVHGGGSEYNRGLQVLAAESRQVKNLKERLEPFLNKSASSSARPKKDSAVREATGDGSFPKKDSAVREATGDGSFPKKDSAVREATGDGSFPKKDSAVREATGDGSFLKKDSAVREATGDGSFPKKDSAVKEATGDCSFPKSTSGSEQTCDKRTKPAYLLKEKYDTKSAESHTPEETGGESVDNEWCVVIEDSEQSEDNLDVRTYPHLRPDSVPLSPIIPKAEDARKRVHCKKDCISKVKRSRHSQFDHSGVAASHNSKVEVNRNEAAVEQPRMETLPFHVSEYDIEQQDNDDSLTDSDVSDESIWVSAYDDEEYKALKGGGKMQGKVKDSKTGYETQSGCDEEEILALSPVKRAKLSSGTERYDLVTAAGRKRKHRARGKKQDERASSNFDTSSLESFNTAPSPDLHKRIIVEDHVRHDNNEVEGERLKRATKSRLPGGPSSSNADKTFIVSAGDSKGGGNKFLSSPKDVAESEDNLRTEIGNNHQQGEKEGEQTHTFYSDENNSQTSIQDTIEASMDLLEAGEDKEQQSGDAGGTASMEVVEDLVSDNQHLMDDIVAQDQVELLDSDILCFDTEEFTQTVSKDSDSENANRSVADTEEFTQTVSKDSDSENANRSVADTEEFTQTVSKDSDSENANRSVADTEEFTQTVSKDSDSENETVSKDSDSENETVSKDSDSENVNRSVLTVSKDSDSENANRSVLTVSKDSDSENANRSVLTVSKDSDSENANRSVLTVSKDSDSENANRSVAETEVSDLNYGEKSNIQTRCEPPATEGAGSSQNLHFSALNEPAGSCHTTRMGHLRAADSKGVGKSRDVKQTSDRESPSGSLNKDSHLGSHDRESPSGSLNKDSHLGSHDRESPSGSLNKDSHLGSHDRESPSGSLNKDSHLGSHDRESPSGSLNKDSHLGSHDRESPSGSLNKDSHLGSHDRESPSGSLNKDSHLGSHDRESPSGSLNKDSHLGSHDRESQTELHRRESRGVSHNREFEVCTQQSETPTGSSEVSSSTDSLGSQSQPRCLLRTATVLVRHHHASCSSLQQVLEHPPPYKFRIQARVVSLRPRPATAGDIVHYLCPSCKFFVRISSCQRGTFNFSPGSNLPLCPRCTRGSERVTLRPVLVFVLQLSDGQHSITATVWDHEAEQFFLGTTAYMVLNNEANFVQVKKWLDDLCPLDSQLQDRPILECCVASYQVRGKKMFQIFDTALSSVVFKQIF